MHPAKHFGVSVAAGGAVWAITGQPLTLPLTVAAGVLIDADHAPDIWWNFVLRRRPVFTVLLHAWEWLTGLLLLAILKGFPWWMGALLVGYGLHLITDHLFNAKTSAWLYLLAYRARHRFSGTKLLREWDRGFEHAHGALQQRSPLAARLFDRFRSHPNP